VCDEDQFVDNKSRQAGKQVFHKQDALITGPVSSVSTEGASLSTENSGKLNRCDPDHVDAADPVGDEFVTDELASGADLASGALASARAMAAGRSDVAARRQRRRPNRNAPAMYSGAKADERDPQQIGAIVGRALPELGWVAPLATARLLGQWAEIVGADIAAHCQPVSLADGDLRISAESTAWATQLRLMAPRILARVASEMPAGMVTKLVISGPTGPTWKRGPWSMHGGRGVRDTYG
jgi:predicted nucleic acid-binding Zn ribbon protein